jgi:hypothetical protein
VSILFLGQQRFTPHLENGFVLADPMPALDRKDDVNDPRLRILRRFRNFAIFWIIVLVTYFVGVGLYLNATGTPIANATPILILLFGCILIAAVWHAAAVVTMSTAGFLDRN